MPRLHLRDPRRGSAGHMQMALSAILLGMDLPDAIASHSPWRIVFTIALCGASAASAIWTPQAVITTCAAALAGAIFTPRELGAAFYAPLLTILGAVMNRRLRWAIAGTAWCWIVSVGATWYWTQGRREQSLAVILWLGLYAIPWLLGIGFRRQNQADRDELLSQLEAQRATIAGELHDTLSHDLALIIMQAEQSMLTDPHSPSIGALRDVATTARRSSLQLRTMMNLLKVNAAAPPLALSTAIFEAGSTLRDHDFTPRIDCRGPVEDLRPALSDTLARIVREATNNIIRHGDPTGTCDLSLAIEPTYVQLDLCNQMRHARQPERLGLPGMRDRIAAAGGTLTVSSDQHQWQLRIRCPR